MKCVYLKGFEGSGSGFWRVEGYKGFVKGFVLKVLSNYKYIVLANYCTISIDSSSHASQGLWSGPNFGPCHTSHRLWTHVTNGLLKILGSLPMSVENTGYWILSLK